MEQNQNPLLKDIEQDNSPCYNLYTDKIQVPQNGKPYPYYIRANALRFVNAYKSMGKHPVIYTALPMLFIMFSMDWLQSSLNSAPGSNSPTIWEPANPRAFLYPKFEEV